jgi:hypothetical protein
MNPAEAEKKQLEIMRKFSNAKRLKLCLALTELTKKLHQAGLVSLHKDGLRRAS